MNCSICNLPVKSDFKVLTRQTPNGKTTTIKYNLCIWCEINSKGDIYELWNSLYNTSFNTRNK